MREKPKLCDRCEGTGWCWRTPDHFNPFLAGGFQTAAVMFKATCPCRAGRAALGEERT